MPLPPLRKQLHNWCAAGNNVGVLVRILKKEGVPAVVPLLCYKVEAVLLLKQVRFWLKKVILIVLYCSFRYVLLNLDYWYEKPIQ